MNFLKEWLADLGIDSKVTAMDSGKLGDVILSGEFDLFQWDWYVEPDPDGILADFTCDQRGGLSDSWYCDKAYDAMYKQQNGEMDKAKRIEIVKAMQQKLYEDSPYIVVAETTQGQAVRTDRFACFQPQPDPGGVWLIQYGGHNYNQFRPTAQAGDCDGVASAIGASASSSTSSSDDGGGSNTAAWIGGRSGRRRPRGWRRAAGAAPGQRRPSASDAAQMTTVVTNAPAPPVARRRTYLSYVGVQGAGRVRQPVLRPGAELLPLPGAAGRPGPHAGPRAVPHGGAARGVPAHLRPRPVAAAPVRHLPRQHAAPGTSACRCATGCRSAS